MVSQEFIDELTGNEPRVARLIPRQLFSDAVLGIVGRLVGNPKQSRAIQGNPGQKMAKKAIDTIN